MDEVFTQRCTQTRGKRRWCGACADIEAGAFNLRKKPAIGLTFRSNKSADGMAYITGQAAPPPELMRGACPICSPALVR